MVNFKTLIFKNNRKTAQENILSASKKAFAFFAPLAVFLILSASNPALASACGTAGGLGTVICTTVESVSEVPALFSGISYLFGLIIGVWGLVKLYEHALGQQQTTVWPGIQRFIVAGCLFALPLMMEVVENTFFAGTTGNEIVAANWNGATSGGGLDAMLVNLMSDTFYPMKFLVAGFCYLSGIILLIIGILRLMKTSQEGARGPGGIGTIMTFLVAGALFSADNLMGAWTTSMFGSRLVSTYADLQFTTGLGADELNHVHAVISAVLAFIMVLGWVSFIRGIFIVRGVAEGDQQATMMAGMTHLFGGALAINLGGVLNAVQSTFGITAYGIQFTN
jgi:hypothetical protein